MALTDTWLKANYNKSQEKMRVVSDRDGLSVRVSPKGRITYQLRYWYGGKQDRIDLGSYPLVSLKQARAEAMRLRAMVEQGDDPKAVRRKERQRQDAAMTVEAAYRLWHKEYVAEHKRESSSLLRSFEIHIFPKLGDQAINDVTMAQWMKELDRVKKKHPITTRKLLTDIKQMYRWLVKREYVDKLPLESVSSKHDLHIRNNQRSRVLDDQEIKLLWECLDESRMHYRNKLFIRLCLILGCRSGELQLCEHSHWDFTRKVWTVPPDNHKSGSKTNRPLVRPIIPIVEEYIGEAMAMSASPTFVFTPDGRDSKFGRRPALQTPYTVRQWARANRGVEMAHWSLHDLRRTMRTRLSKLTQPHVAEIMLGHVAGEVYDQYDYLEEQNDAYLAWWRRLQEIVS